jgi:hypothetical protein
MGGGYLGVCITTCNESRRLLHFLRKMKRKVHMLEWYWGGACLKHVDASALEQQCCVAKAMPVHDSILPAQTVQPFWTHVNAPPPISLFPSSQPEALRISKD